MIVIPLTAFLAVEAGLRLGGYGFPTGFFKSQKIGAEQCLVENDRFGLRFFPPEVARSPAPVVMKARKEPGACRIFILGESAALGDPRPAYGAGRYLAALLREKFPKGKFEVVCVAMTAINSHAIREIARECARHEGDLWILYLGNNEMVGPFGAAGVLGAEAPPLAIVRFNLALQRTRTGQLLLAVARKLKKRPAEGTWGGMEMWVKNRIAPGDPRKEVVYGNFRRNLDDVLRMSKGAGAKVILSTMAVNLKDCPPLATLSATNLSGTDQANVNLLQKEGLAAFAGTNIAQAVEALGRAAKLDATRADIEFQLGSALLAEREPSRARPHLERARDLDALPFRADSRLNRDISEAAAKYAGPGFSFFDAQELLATNSPVGIAGEESFYEHVHLNFAGNYLLARAWAEQSAQLLPQKLTGPAAEGWATQELCERRLGLTDWNRASVVEDVLFRLRQPPLSTQAHNDQRLERFRARLRELRRGMTKEAAAEARDVYEQAVARDPGDHRLHENFAEFLEEVGDLSLAIKEWQQVTALLPHHHVAYFQEGRLLARTGQFAPAETALRESVSLRPDLSEGWLELGKVDLARGNPELALTDLHPAQRLQPQDYRVHHQKGKVLSKLNRRPEAIQAFREAVRLNPRSWEALYSLGEELAFNGQETEARARFNEVLKLKPDHAMAHLNLGVCFVKTGQLQDAAREFEETLRRDPNNKLARDYLEQVKRRL